MNSEFTKVQCEQIYEAKNAKILDVEILIWLLLIV
jgi:hypothetical protein